VLARITV